MDDIEPDAPMIAAMKTIGVLSAAPLRARRRRKKVLLSFLWACSACAKLPPLRKDMACGP